ncbi:MAG: hypothetical protein ACRESR_10400 [Gammaproteobacteria bacterium]
MNRRLISHLPLTVAALTLLAFASVGARAMQSGKGSPQSRPVYTITQKATKLSPITVYGKHVPFPLALQLYKKALTRAWSSNPADLNKLVCKWQHETGTHFHTLYCRTNRQHQKLASATQLSWTNGASEYTNTPGRHASALYKALVNGQIPMQLAGFTTAGKHIRRSSFEPLLKKLPPADSSYTLRVTDHGKPLIDYVIKNGNLVHVYEYVYKKSKKGEQKKR